MLLWTGYLFLGNADLHAQTTTTESELTNDEEHHHYVRPLPEPMGFAFFDEPTTGGAGGAEVTVTNAEQLLRYATSDDPYVINVVDTIEIVRGIGGHEETNGEYHLGSNTTLRGVGTHATIKYGGFRVADVENVIIQNLTFDGTYKGYHSSLEGISCSEVPEGQHRYKNGPCLSNREKGPTDNALEITAGSERVWITQNIIKRYSDEAMSIRSEASYVTLSWNRYDDPVSGKNGMMILIGHYEGNLADRGRLKTTIHHNTFGASSRQPRVRFGEVHIFNNYYYNPHGIFSYGAAAQMEAEVAIEGNYFDGVGNRPWRYDINNNHGHVDQRNNIFEDTNIPATRGSIGEEIFEPADRYDYTMDDPEDIPDLVMADAGAGAVGDYSAQILPAPGIPVMSSPLQASGESVRPEFSWEEAIFAVEYDLEIKDGVSEDIPAVVDTTLADTQFVYPEELEALEGNKTYFWRVRAVNEDGAGQWSQFEYFTTEQVTAAEEEEQTPSEFTLSENYPNPFNPSTTISFGLSEQAHVEIRVYDVTGREIATLVDEQRSAGSYNVEFATDSVSLSSGIYLYRMVATPVSGNGGSFTKTKKMNLIK